MTPPIPTRRRTDHPGAVRRRCPACGWESWRPYESRAVCPDCGHVDLALEPRAEPPAEHLRNALQLVRALACMAAEQFLTADDHLEHLADVQGIERRITAALDGIARLEAQVRGGL